MSSCVMSANDLLGADLPSDSDSDDEDYVSEGSGSSSESSFEMEDDEDKKGRGFQKEIRRHKIARLFEQMKNEEQSKLETETHPDVLVDPLMFEFQRVSKSVPNKSLEFVLNDLKKFSNIVKDSHPIDVGKYKARARSDLVSSSTPSGYAADDAVARALAGLSASRVEVEEEVRFAGEVVRLKKSVEKSSSHAAKFERKKRAAEEAVSGSGSGSLGGLQSYLNQIKSRRAVTSVEKSAVDWNQLKLSSEGMEQSLKTDRGFLDKKAFLVRSDLKEDDMRRDARRKRLLEQATPTSNLP